MVTGNISILAPCMVLYLLYLLFPSNLTENRPEQDSFGGGTSLSLHDDKLVQRSGYFHRLRREHAELDR